MEVSEARNATPPGLSTVKVCGSLLWIYGGVSLLLMTSYVWNPFLAGYGGFESARFWLLSLSALSWLASIGIVVTVGAKAVYCMIRYESLSKLNTTGHVGAFAIAAAVIVVWVLLWVFPIRPQIEKLGAQYRLNRAGGGQAHELLVEAAKKMIAEGGKKAGDFPEIFHRLGGRRVEVQNDPEGDPQPRVIVHTSDRPLRADWYIFGNPVPNGYRAYPYGIIEVEPGVYRWSE